MLLAVVTFWGPDRGGRFTPPMPGFHPQIRVGNESTSCIVHSTENDVKSFTFNKPYRVKLELMFPEQYSGSLSVGDEVCLLEGTKQIAQGKIIEVI